MFSRLTAHLQPNCCNLDHAKLAVDVELVTNIPSDPDRQQSLRLALGRPGLSADLRGPAADTQLSACAPHPLCQPRAATADRAAGLSDGPHQPHRALDRGALLCRTHLDPAAS